MAGVASSLPAIEHPASWLPLARDFADRCRERGKAINAQRWTDGRSPVDVSIEGSLGEWAACRYLGVKPNLEVVDGDDGGHDFVRCGLRCDPKATGYVGTGNLVLCMNEEIEADVLILTWTTHERTVLPGWVSRERFIKERVERDMGHGLRWFMAKDDLSQMRDLRALVEILDDDF